MKNSKGSENSRISRRKLTEQDISDQIGIMKKNNIPGGVLSNQISSARRTSRSRKSEMSLTESSSSSRTPQVRPEIEIEIVEEPEIPLVGEDFDEEQDETFVKRGWCFTINNYDSKDYDKFYDLSTLKPKVQYAIAGKETAPTTGTPHLQCFIYFVNEVKGFNFIKKHWPKASKIQFIRKSPYINFEYCSSTGRHAGKKGSTGEFVEYGKRPVGEGTRTDLQLIRDGVVKGEYKTLKDIVANENLTLNYQTLRFAEKMISICDTPRNLSSPPIVEWYYGSAGCNKSREARKRCKTLGNYWEMNPEMKWWDSYTGQEIVMIDDLDEVMLKTMPGGVKALLKLFDVGPFNAGIKGSMVQVQAKHFIITSHALPSDVFGTATFSSGDSLQLERRITRVLRFDRRKRIHDETLDFLKSVKHRMIKEDSEEEEDNIIVDINKFVPISLDDIVLEKDFVPKPKFQLRVNEDKNIFQ